MENMAEQFSSSSPQTVETERLLLRPFVDDDFVTYERIRANPEVARYLPGGIEAVKSAPERARQTMQTFARHWQERGFGPWAVIDKQTRVLIGHCGLRYLPEFDAVELLYALDPSAWGKGLATEAAHAALDYGRTELGLPRIIALALPDNRASLRVMERVGMRYVKTAAFQGYEVVLYEVSLRPIVQ